MSAVIPSEALLGKAFELGFERAGIADAAPPRSLSAYRDWLAAGMHGDMAYLLDHLPRKSSPQELLPGAQSILVAALHYGPELPCQPGRMKVARYAQGRDYHKVLRQKLKTLASWLEEQHPGIGYRICVDTAPVLERDYAQQAGIGWFGKNTMLIDSRTGSWFFLAAMLLDRKFAPTAPAVGGCGSCRACIDACPTGAIVYQDGRWQIDARRCISYLTIEHRGEIEPALAEKIGDWTFGCDVCQEVCPFNQPRASQPLRAPNSNEPDFVPKRDWPELERVAELPWDEWDALTRGSAVRRAGYEGLKRNARINLANRKREEEAR